MAYVSDESGRDEIYAVRFPLLDSRVTISRDGGPPPLWSRDGTEVFYRDRDNRLVAARVRLGTQVAVIDRTPLFSLDQYQVSGCGCITMSRRTVPVF